MEKPKCIISFQFQWLIKFLNSYGKIDIFIWLKALSDIHDEKKINIEQIKQNYMKCQHKSFQFRLMCYCLAISPS